MIRLAITLMLVCLASSSVLSLTFKMTSSMIISQKESEERDSLKIALPEAANFKKRKDYYIAYKDKKISGYVLKLYAKGYSSTIEMLAGIDPQGTIRGITILEQKETPGMGAKIEEIKYGENEPWFLKQFRNKSTQEINLSKIEAITGATISSRAVVNSVRAGVENFMNTIRK